MNGRDSGLGARDSEELERRESSDGSRNDGSVAEVRGALAIPDGNQQQGAAESDDNGGRAGQKISRREAVGLLATLPLGVALPWTAGPIAGGLARPGVAPGAIPEPRAPSSDAPKFFTPHEYDTVRVLVDLIIPRDARSGSATDAGVPEFIDFMMTDRPEQQTPIRGGLAWMDAECVRRFGKTFVDSADAERRALLDDIAWPKKARPELSQGVAFFNRMRDLTASGFWSSKMGVEDLQYRGNTYVREWTGCPPAALEKLGVKY